MMNRVLVETTHKTYPVIIGEGAVQEISRVILDMPKAPTRLFVIADEAVYALHGEALRDALPSSIATDWHFVPAGESAKSFSVFEQCLTAMLEAALDRRSLVIAFGGGACGDLAGFCAASYMRGIPFIQVPTTILAHDSAVGGKTAINHPLGKNMIGAFHQPEAVVYDTAFLKSLSEKETRSGFAEVIKHALIADPSLLENIQQSVKSAEDIKGSFLEHCLQRGIEIKSAIVKEDEKETGVRAFLNFGHTYGHAVEALSGYGKTAHGEAVACGMIFALYASQFKNDLSFDTSSFAAWLKRAGYPVKAGTVFSFEDIYAVMARDKKAYGGTVRFVLLNEVGKPYVTEMTKEELQHIDEHFRKESDTW
ncbi:3-dehydroquinate synthase [Domibacillus sp. DTU_2020_1001157_1_SI_ALB_TIR_016]|uniref:3-dehydroquinate synthase n=1 Tax=Domibacillus sp. DTU_2020_1001157_1_SI_ALB_TIR_016 TaxID=3077789 RepID=UPI0028EFBD26|nr:3-dehydroquinate synthase [Domibacillus sp. DTU_2020_1001157_1_SI_ALB_TIR_016]WNS82086.1 3-dehydroquinate synthase [Domibacillus sp. DTU_2020_1001157_1_SI_ALB_TIR_016]